MSDRMILLLSNSLDFATDFVVSILRSRGSPYLRLDLDLLSADEIALDPIAGRMSILIEGKYSEVFNHEVSSVLYRAPTFLRESSSNRWSPEVLLKRHQWAAFARSFVVFDAAFWMNHPQALFLAEIKPLQLRLAAKHGFRTPVTSISNHLSKDVSKLLDSDGHIAVKALDTFLLAYEDSDLFFYTQDLGASDLESNCLQDAPVILQQFVDDKLDLRVTVVCDSVLAVSITKGGRGIQGDWRLHKDSVELRSHRLPPVVSTQCLALCKELGLTFAAIDLLLSRGEYWFLEVNPTGEWAWLLSVPELPIDVLIAEALMKGNET